MEITVLPLMSQSSAPDALVRLIRPAANWGAGPGITARGLRDVLVQVDLLDLRDDLAAAVMPAGPANVMRQFQLAAIGALGAAHRSESVMRAPHVPFRPGFPVLLDRHVNPLPCRRAPPRGPCSNISVRLFQAPSPETTAD